MTFKLKNIFNYTAVLLVICLAIVSCGKNEENKEVEIKQTPFYSYIYLLDANRDTLISHQFELSKNGKSALLSLYLLSVVAGNDRELILWGSNFITPDHSVWDTISVFYEIKYFTLEEMDLDFYNHGELRADEIVDFIWKERDRVNKPPYKLEFLYDYMNPNDGNIYTNKVAKDKFLPKEYRFVHEQAGMEVRLDSIEKVETHGYFRGGGWIEFVRLKGVSFGYLHNRRDWSDSIYVEGGFDLLFNANTLFFD